MLPQGDQWRLKPWKPARGGGGGHVKVPDPYMGGQMVKAFTKWISIWYPYFVWLFCIFQIKYIIYTNQSIQQFGFKYWRKYRVSNLGQGKLQISDFSVLIFNFCTQITEKTQFI